MPSPHIFNAKFNLSALACKVGCTPNTLLRSICYIICWCDHHYRLPFFFRSQLRTWAFLLSYKIRLFLILLWFWNSGGSVKYKLRMECWAELNLTNFLFGIKEFNSKENSEIYIGHLFWQRGQRGCLSQFCIHTN